MWALGLLQVPMQDYNLGERHRKVSTQAEESIKQHFVAEL
jgi:hypothetical protein